ncbi:formylglycine-generating enzyme family protein [Paremcibacter congregatus]|uniref:formylglycine-generating enzyme family protein n=1 Tax=Paremcibacter congregatus TaxID=2043170 RepID=UPI003A8EE4C4
MNMRKIILTIAGLLFSCLALNACANESVSTKELETGQVFKECDDCPEMVVIPSGKFVMGLNPKVKMPAVYTKFQVPARQVIIPRKFAMGRFEITYAQYLTCFEDGGCSKKPGAFGWGGVKQPLMNASWDQAQEYVKWLSRKTDEKYRLPSEAEWEYGARAGTETVFWWGDAVGEMNAKCKACLHHVSYYLEAPVPIGNFRPNPFGLYDMLGNVSELVQDCFVRGYDHVASSNSSKSYEIPDCKLRSVRGGNYGFEGARSLLPSYRGGTRPSAPSYPYGFRVVREIE